MYVVKKIFKYFYDQKTLEDRIFSFVLIIGIFVVAASTVVTYAEDLSGTATIFTSSSGIFLIFILIMAYGFGRIEESRLILCYFLNVVILPITFIACGGINSGMPLYFLAGLFAIIPILKGRNRVICFAITLIADIFVMGLSYNMMDGTKATTRIVTELFTNLSLEERIVDFMTSLILVSLFLGITTALILSSYQDERSRSEELLDRLDNLSKIDELTGLYNRRELFNYLDSVDLFDNNHFYIAMFDIDYFKNVNDTYGHVFGDVALRTVAQELGRTVSTSNEIAARYGGEEFVILMQELSAENAYKRVDAIRQEVQKLKWDVDEGLVVTISGGLIDCADYHDLKTAISAVDRLLYDAKHTGRNRINM